MRVRVSLLALACILAIAGCQDPSSPAPAVIWRTCCIPSGGYTELDLSVTGSRVTGTGSYHGVQGVLEGLFTVTGTWSPSSINLTISPTSGQVQAARFDGSLVTATQLAGSWTAGGTVYQRVFFKQ